MLRVASVSCNIAQVRAFSISIDIDLRAVLRTAAGVKDFKTYCLRIDSVIDEILLLYDTEMDFV